MRATNRMSVPSLELKAGRDRSLRRRHPWVFSGAIERVRGAPKSGDTVQVRASDGKFLAWAAYSPASQIRARVWSFDEDQPPGEGLFAERISAALELRRALIPTRATNALRLIHGESDGLPGFVADSYAGVLVVQVLSAGCERWRDALLGIVHEKSGCSAIYERSDTEARELEGLTPRSGRLAGSMPDGPVRIVENGIEYEVDVIAGQKTGFYLDQRDNRSRVQRVAEGREALNCFCYTGGFALAAISGGARSVLSIDSSAAALECARGNLALNRFDAKRAQWLEADVFDALRKLRSDGRQFDLIVMDPPKFAPTPKDTERAARGYKDINLNALRLLRRGGLLATFSCSGGVSRELFRKIVAGAAADAGASLVLRAQLDAAPDHPLLMEFPEGEYLKGFLLERR